MEFERAPEIRSINYMKKSNLGSNVESRVKLYFDARASIDGFSGSINAPPDQLTAFCLESAVFRLQCAVLYNYPYLLLR